MITAAIFGIGYLTLRRAFTIADPRSAPADPSDSVARVKSGGYIYSLLQREDG